jgi:hypothetical protein
MSTNDTATTTEIVAKFVLEKETRNTFKFAEVDEGGAEAGAWGKIGSLYVQKTAFPRGTPAPKHITVAIKVAA